jgi:glycerate-2-kinase
MSPPSAAPRLRLRLRRDAVAIAMSCLPKIHATRLVRRSLRDAPALDRIHRADRLFCVAVGKAAEAMYDGVRGIAGRPLDGAFLVTSGGAPIGQAEVVRGGHPVPDDDSDAAAHRLEAFVRGVDAGPDDVVVVCVSGGASAMLSSPVPGLSAADLRSVSADLVLAGIDVTAVNAVRSRLSRLHGGGLLALAGRASCVGLVLCDNVQVGPAAVGSGLTYGPVLSVDVAIEAVGRHVRDPGLRSRVQRALAEREAHEPLPAPPADNIVVGTPGDALRECGAAAGERGYGRVVLTDRLQGEAREVAGVLAAVARFHARVAPDPVCVLAAGEVTVTVTGPGTGGRCQELAWAVAGALPDDIVASFVALATDGRDFVPGATGAWVTSDTVAVARRRGISFNAVLRDNDTHPALATLGQTLPALHTGTNLCDVYVLCAVPA